MKRRGSSSEWVRDCVCDVSTHQSQERERERRDRCSLASLASPLTDSVCGDRGGRQERERDSHANSLSRREEEREKEADEQLERGLATLSHARYVLSRDSVRTACTRAFEMKSERREVERESRAE